MAPQLQMKFPRRRTWGGARKGAGRKPAPGRPRVSHGPRDAITPTTPVLITLRLVSGIPSLRHREAFALLLRAFQQGRERFGARLIHFSVQTNHLHLVVEADDSKALTRFMAGLKIRIARAVNRHLGRKGAVFSDRYHSKTLSNPTAVHNAVLYVLNNDLRHSGRRATAFDYFSSSPYFDGWSEGAVSWPRPLAGPPPCVAPRSWALREGWRRAGSISLTHIPGPPS